MCLKIENYFLKIFMKIRVNKKIVKNTLKYVKYYLKIKNNCLKIKTKHSLKVRLVSEFENCYLEFFENF